MYDFKTFIIDNFGLTEVLSPVYLACYALIAALVYLIRKEDGSFLAFLFPKHIFTHKSNLIDLSLFAMNRVIGFFGLFARFAAGPAVAIWVADRFPYSLVDGASLSPLAIALLVYIIADCTLYFIHRGFHRVKTIWPLHAVHHSAKVMTPLTTYRQHPAAVFISASLNSIIFGVLFGVIAGAFSPDLTMAQIAGANAFVVLANMTFTNFQHSHIWISFGPMLERIFISPAQHQIHHSTARRHFDKNFGQTFALWDWMFGTLYVINGRENINFGLEDQADEPLMTQRLGPILMDPLRRMIRPPQ